MSHVFLEKVFGSRLSGRPRRLDIRGCTNAGADRMPASRVNGEDNNLFAYKIRGMTATSRAKMSLSVSFQEKVFESRLAAEIFSLYQAHFVDHHPSCHQPSKFPAIVASMDVSGVARCLARSSSCPPTKRNKFLNYSKTRNSHYMPNVNGNWIPPS